MIEQILLWLIFIVLPVGGTVLAAIGTPTQRREARHQRALIRIGHLEKDIGIADTWESPTTNH